MTWRLGDLATPKSVQKLQAALHAKAKADPGYRFYVLYDKISRADILAHAYALCRSNKGAPGVDGQDFADVEAYGLERWLGELAHAAMKIGVATAVLPWLGPPAYSRRRIFIHRGARPPRWLSLSRPSRDGATAVRS